jgi:hypothetical protein
MVPSLTAKTHALDRAGLGKDPEAARLGQGGGGPDEVLGAI